MRLIDADIFLYQLEGQYMEHDLTRKEYIELEDRIMQQPTVEIPKPNEGLKDGQPDVPDTNVGNVISRQAAIDAVNRAATKEAARWSIQELPSVAAVQDEWIVREYCTNELNYRKWIEIECPFCGERPTYENLDSMNYCPNCGAKMDKGGDE